MKVGARAVLLLLAILLAPRSVQSTPANVFGFGPRSQALAGTGAALGRGFETTYNNPALLSRSEGPEAAVGWQAARFSVDIRGGSGHDAASQEGLEGAYFGLVLPLPLAGPLENRIALGCGTFSPSRLVVRARLLVPERPQLPLLSDHVQSVNAAGGLGVDLGYGLRVGAGALALGRLAGDIVVATNADGRVGADAEEQLVAAYAPVAAAAYEAGKGFVFGAVWRGALSGEFDMKVRVLDLGELVIPELNISGIAQYDPMQLGAELGRRWGDWQVAVGATYKRWSAFRGWQRATVSCTRERPDCAALGVERVDSDDTLVPRASVEHRLELSARAAGYLRAGYFFEPSPLPEQTDEQNLWDNDRHALTMGYGVELRGAVGLDLDLFYQLHVLAPRRHTKSAGVAPSNPGHPEVRVSGLAHATGLAATLRF